MSPLPPLVHLDDCPQTRPPSSMFSRAKGCFVFSCLDCLRWGGPPATPRRPYLGPIRFVCRLHLGEPVDHRGRGCRRCAEPGDEQ